MAPVRRLIGLDHLRGTIALAAGATDNKQVAPVSAVLELLQEARAVQIEGDTVGSATPFRDVIEGLTPVTEPVELPPGKPRLAETPQIASNMNRIPLPPGPKRPAYLELPLDWHGENCQS